jgi:hypothetical protein
MMRTQKAYRVVPADERVRGIVLDAEPRGIDALLVNNAADTGRGDLEHIAVARRQTFSSARSIRCGAPRCTRSDSRGVTHSLALDAK